MRISSLSFAIYFAFLSLALLSSVCYAYQLPSLSVARQGIAGAAVGNWVAFAGGIVIGSDSAALDFYQISPTLHQGSPQYSATLTTAMSHHIAAAASAGNGTGVWAFGTGFASSALSAQIELWSVSPDPTATPARTAIMQLPNSAVTDAAAVGVLDLIVIVGGVNVSNLASNSICTLNVTSGAFTLSQAQLPTGVAQAAIASWGSYFVVSGGVIDSGAATGAMYLYHVTSGDTITPTAQWTLPARYAHTLGMNAYYIMAAGGYNGSAVLQSVDVIHLSDGSISTTALSSPRRDMAGACGTYDCIFIGGSSTSSTSRTVDTIGASPGLASALATTSHSISVADSAVARTNTDAVVVAGGKVSSGTGLASEVFVYGHLVTQPTLTLSTPRYALAGGSWGSVIAFAGGCTSPPGAPCASVSAAVDVYNASTNSMVTPAVSLKIGRRELCAASAMGYIAFAGGYNEGATVYDVIELYDPGNNAVMLAPANLSSSRYAMACVGYSTFMVFSGGRTSPTGNSWSFTVDILDLSAGTLTQYTLAEERAYHAIVMVPMVTQLFCMVGGQNSTTSAIAQIDCYSSSFNQANSVFDPNLPQATMEIGAVALPFGSSSVALMTYGGKASTNLMPTNTGYLLYPGSSSATLPLSGNATGIVALAIFGDAKATMNLVPLKEIYINDHYYRTTATLAAARRSHAGAASTSNGVYAFAGGVGITSNVLGDIELFANSWLSAPGPTFLPPQVTLPPQTSTAPPLTSSLPSPSPSATTTPAPIVCTGSPPISGAVCVNGVWVIANSSSPTTVNITAGQQVQVNGSLTLLPVSVTQITSDGASAPISVSGVIVLDGTLTLVLTNVPINGTLVPLIAGAGEVNGSFNAIEVDSPRGCQRVTGTSVATANTYAVLLTVDNGGCKKRGLTTGQKVALAVGCAVGALLLLLLGLLLYQRRNPSSTFFRRRKRRRDMHVEPSPVYS